MEKAKAVPDLERLEQLDKRLSALFEVVENLQSSQKGSALGDDDMEAFRGRELKKMEMCCQR
jgi:hypothetical protein